MPKWSCEETNGQKQCRNPHGCHCAEIDALQARLKSRATIARRALRGIDTYAWSMVTVRGSKAATTNLQKRIDACRKALAEI